MNRNSKLHGSYFSLELSLPLPHHFIPDLKQGHFLDPVAQKSDAGMMLRRDQRLARR